MCFEAAEYIVDTSLCSRCDWAKCWPVVGCLTQHAVQRVDNGSLARTCHDNEFSHSQELANYMKCWKIMPKHTSHWNILSSLVHCICREGVKRKAREAHCCGSLLHGGGVCDLECVSEQACASQEAQTCIHECQRKCPAYDVVPSTECMDQCLKTGVPCRKYTSCRPPSVHTHVCNDGRWPEAASGCCKDTATQVVGCPHLCEQQRVWRLDRTSAIPWWARKHDGPGIISQCTCSGCPANSSSRAVKLRQTVSESIWDNGQVMLVDVARREGLRLGPNRKMQEIMLDRNSEILRTIQAFGDNGASDKMISVINGRYSQLITDAARLGDDPQGGVPFTSGSGGGRRRRGAGRGEGSGGEGSNVAVIVAVVVTCSVAVLAAMGVATWLVLRRRRLQSPISAFEQNQQIVIGSPVPQGGNQDGVAAGAPVTVAAPTKNQRSGPQVPKDLS